MQFFDNWNTTITRYGRNKPPVKSNKIIKTLQHAEMITEIYVRQQNCLQRVISLQHPDANDL